MQWDEAVLFFHIMPTSLYFHIPFCTTRCGYCDFNTYAGVNNLIPGYIDAICQEVEFYAKIAEVKLPVHTIFFGGGTPSLLPLDDLKNIIQTVNNNYAVTNCADISLEANPGSVNAEYFQGLHEIGFTRISLGMQSAHANELETLNRKHDFRKVKQSVLWAKAAGFKHISLDLIFGIPGQTMKSWERSIDLALNLPIDHVSLYSLTVEEGTLLQRQITEGQVAMPDDDLAGEMYEFVLDYLPSFGFKQYEISNWSISRESRSLHNIQYWKCLPYLGFGAGAHGYFAHYRYENIAAILPYIASSHQPFGSEITDSPFQIQGNKLELWDEMQEFMMVGLRLTEDGISRTDFKDRFNHPVEDMFGSRLGKLTHLNLIEDHPDDDDKLRLTPKGIVFGNRVFSEFVGNKKPDLLND